MNELSTINKSMKMINPILIALIGVFVSYIVFNSNQLWFFISTIVIFVLGIFYYKKVSSKVFELYFDNEYLFLKSENDSRKIKIDKIKSLESTSHQIKILGFPFYKHRIEFINENSIKETVKFWVFANNRAYEKFYKMIYPKT